MKYRVKVSILSFLVALAFWCFVAALVISQPRKFDVALTLLTLVAIPFLVGVIGFLAPEDD